MARPPPPSSPPLVSLRLPPLLDLPLPACLLASSRVLVGSPNLSLFFSWIPAVVERGSSLQGCSCKIWSYIFCIVKMVIRSSLVYCCAYRLRPAHASTYCTLLLVAVLRCGAVQGASCAALQ